MSKAQPSPKPSPGQAARKERQKARERFLAGRKTEAWYSRQLRSVARQVGDFVSGFVGGWSPETLASLRDTLSRYVDLLVPWAKTVAQRMVEDVSRRDGQAWIKQSRTMGRELAREIKTAPTGEAMRQLMNEQVDLITSLPRKAAERVHELTLQGITEGTRAAELAEKILETGHVTASRAMLIARTETARTASALTQARAVHVGSEGYYWRTAEDSDVRPLHRRLNGKFIRWDEPPVSGENGERAHAGMIYNCRCYPEPVIPDLV